MFILGDVIIEKETRKRYLVTDKDVNDNAYVFHDGRRVGYVKCNEEFEFEIGGASEFINALKKDEIKITERVVIHQDRVLEDIRVLINAAYKEGYADGKSEAVEKRGGGE